MLKVKSVLNDICVFDMEDGEIGEITMWDYTPENAGMVVQRYADLLICLGGESGKSYTTIFDYRQENCRVRILKSGEELVLGD